MAQVVTDEASGLQKVVLRTAQGATAEVYLHGAHVTSWKTSSGQEQLFLSQKAVFKPPKAIRGGIPICWPQFNDMGPLSAHGFARNSAFELHHSTADSVLLVLSAAPPEHAAKWPQRFDLFVKVTLGADTLTQELQVKNRGDAPLSFTTALHTYFRVADAASARVEGLAGVEYLDNLAGRERKKEEGDAVRFAGEVDRIYLGGPRQLQVVDEAGGRVVELQLEGFPDAVVWNPWIDKARATADMADDEYKVMVCVEAAVAGSGAVEVAAGQSWSASQTLTARKYES